MAASRRRLQVWTLGAFGFAAFGAAAVFLAFGHEAGIVRTDLLGAQTKLSFVPQIVANRDINGLNQVSGEVLQMTERADAGTVGPLWDLASRYRWSRRTPTRSAS